jgi:hypothetical protein
MAVDFESEFRRLIDSIDKKRAEDGFNPSHRFFSDLPSSIVMLDGKTMRPLSPMMQAFYKISGAWDDAILSKNIIYPKELPSLMVLNQIKERLALRRENYWPDPPYADSDLCRTAFFGIAPYDLDELYFWWRSDDLMEPMVVDFFSGNVFYFNNIYDLLLYYGDNRGDLVIDLLEELKLERADI